MSTTGIAGIVTFGGRPPVVADDVIEHLRREVSVAQNSCVAPLLEEGAWVRILSGCFQYIEGRVLHFDPRCDRVRLLLALLGSEVQVSVSSRQVAPVTQARTCYPSGLMAASAGSAASDRRAV